MQAILKRLVIVASLFIISIVLIHRKKRPINLPAINYRVACIPAPKTKREEDEMDEKLKHYFHLAHTSQEDKNSSIPSYRCYFKFDVKDIACMPPKVAQRTNKVQGCPLFINTEEKSCYFLDKKYGGIITLLRKKPAASIKEYNGNVVKDWKEIRDALISKK